MRAGALQQRAIIHGVDKLHKRKRVSKSRPNRNGPV